MLLKINADAPRSTFYYPMTGLINLFIHILRLPSLSTARSDIALLEVIAGHFANMEFVTGSELSFPFGRNVAALARKTVEKAPVSVMQTPTLSAVEGGFDGQHEMEMPSQVSKLSSSMLVAWVSG